MSKVIKGRFEEELEIKKSRFITTALYVDDVSIVKKELSLLRDKYPKAVHYCYAYKIGDQIKYDDDGEPKNTAGKPIYEVIEKQDLNNILIVVTRIFGGIKLGAGGLTRAYTNATVNVLNKINYFDVVKGYKIEFECRYDVNDNVSYLLTKYDIINYNKQFTTNVIHQFSCYEIDYKKIVDDLHAIDYTIAINILSEVELIKE